MARKASMTPELAKQRKYVSDAEDALDADLAKVYSGFCDIVTTYLLNEVSSGKWTFEEAAINFAKNFVRAYTVKELAAVGQKLEKDMDDHTSDGLP